MKVKYAQLTTRIENGASATFEDSESEEEQIEIKRDRLYSKDEIEMRHRMEMEKEFLKSGNLYGVLELEHLTWEANVKEIRR